MTVYNPDFSSLPDLGDDRAEMNRASHIKASFEIVEALGGKSDSYDEILNKRLCRLEFVAQNGNDAAWRMAGECRNDAEFGPSSFIENRVARLAKRR